MEKIIVENVMSILANNTEWESLSSEKLLEIVDSPEEAGRQFTQFLKSIFDEVRTIKIDRSKPFKGEKFFPFFPDNEWWRIDEEDERSLALTEINLSDVRFEHMFDSKEPFMVSGEMRLERIKKAGYVRLDANIFQILFKNQYLIPEKWKKIESGYIKNIYFDGTIFSNTHGNRYVLSMYWTGRCWGWCPHWLGENSMYYSEIFSAVLRKEVNS
jgi:hypothetical protein